MWFDEAVVYHIYPLGLCGSPKENDGVTEHRIHRIFNWIQHIKDTGANTVLFNPVFQSDRHGYDTRDFFNLDCRLGTNKDFEALCSAIHSSGMKVMLDGVFNHVGRGFFAFKDVCEKKWDSNYKNWFNISFDGNTNYNDGFWYEGWEGHNELVKLNLQNTDVINHIFEAVRFWTETFGIDGLRLDVVYCLDQDFIKRLRQFTQNLKQDFILMGETLHGDYNRLANDEMCYSVTNYECYKGLYSSFNSLNMFEIAHSLQRQFGPEYWTLYKGKHFLCFLDNHDVDRIASILNDKNHLYPAYGLLFSMPGVPSIYYGSEWGIGGNKSPGSDDALRPDIEIPQSNELTKWISKLAELHKASKALCFGSYRNLHITNRQLIFERMWEGERILVAINADEKAYTANFDANAAQGTDIITGKIYNLGKSLDLPPYGTLYLQV